MFHAARQDVEIFLLKFDAVPTPMFDTQVAAMVAGFGDQVSYDQLCRSLADAQIDKAHRFSDWSARPLSASQIAYAAADVTHLRRIYTALSDRLEREGRLDWVAEEMAVLNRARHLPRRPGDRLGAAASRAPPTAASSACCGPSPPGGSGRRSGSTSPASAW